MFEFVDLRKLTVCFVHWSLSILNFKRHALSLSLVVRVQILLELAALASVSSSVRLLAFQIPCARVSSFILNGQTIITL